MAADNRPSTARTGRVAEHIAEAYLRCHGLRLIARNFRSRAGEIDLVMRHDDVVVFVEVRYRRTTRFGTPAETVGAVKQQRLIRAAERFLQAHPRLRARRCRFDVISMTRRSYLPEIAWIKNAIIQCP